MNQKPNAVRTILRIPGNWSDPDELFDRIPAGVQLTPESLILADGTEVEMTPMPPDNQFAQVFRSACRQPARDAELKIVNSYTVNIGLSAAGGSIEAALTMLQAGAAMIRAGAGGVFIDNSGLAHGGKHWLEMAEDGGHDAVSFAFVNIIRGRQDLWTTGMHVLGLPDLALKHSDPVGDTETIIELIRYVCRGEKPLGDGHIVAVENGRRFRAAATTSHSFDPPSPMHNPWGRLQLISMKEIAESN
jgi:hypothetical protein